MFVFTSKVNRSYRDNVRIKILICGEECITNLLIKLVIIFLLQNYNILLRNIFNIGTYKYLIVLYHCLLILALYCEFGSISKKDSSMLQFLH